MKEVEIYFKNENDAEAARADLNKYKVTSLTIEAVPEGRHDEGFIPFYAPSWGRMGTPVPFISDNSGEEKIKKADSEHMSHLVRFEVEEEDYDETIEVLKDHNGYRLKEK